MKTGLEDLRGDICMLSHAIRKYKNYSQIVVEELEKDIEKLILKARRLEEIELIEREVQNK